MSITDMSKVIEIVLAVTRKYGDKDVALRKNLGVIAEIMRLGNCRRISKKCWQKW